MHILDCSCAPGSLHVDPEHPRQMARWLRSRRGTSVFLSLYVWCCVSLSCLCTNWLTLAHSATFPLSRQFAGYSINQFEPSYTILGPWWLNWARCSGTSITPSHKPLLWTWRGRFAPTDGPSSNINDDFGFWDERPLSLLWFSDGAHICWRGAPLRQHPKPHWSANLHHTQHISARY